MVIQDDVALGVIAMVQRVVVMSISIRMIKEILLDASVDCRSKANKLQKMEKDIASTMSAISETQSSFKNRINSTLININIEKYIFSMTVGRVLRQTSINNDVYILEKH